MLCAELQKVMPEPKPRSKTWLSTCFPAGSEDEAAKTCGADYHVSFTSLSCLWHVPVVHTK